MREFQRVAIVNRGEAAMRFIHAAREFNQEYGTSLCTIALYTEPDRHAMFVCEADEAVFPRRGFHQRSGYGSLQEQLC
jgi:acetyl/propionyl-CoA carboxylase alpha subunit